MPHACFMYTKRFKCLLYFFLILTLSYGAIFFISNVLILIYFTWKRMRDTYTHTYIFHPLAYSLNSCKRQDWVRPKPTDSDLVQFSHIGGRTVTLESSSTEFLRPLAEIRIQNMVSGTQTRSHMGC